MTGDEWPLQRLLTEVVGSGPKSAEDMTADQAREACHRILSEDSDPTTLGAFLLANRWKRNTPTELAAFLDVMREESVTPIAPSCPVVDCGANYDGKERTALLGVAAGLVSAAAGTNVVAHSGDRVPSKYGTTYKHVLDELGVDTEVPPATSAEMVEATGFGFYYQPAFNPGVDGLLARRERMGVRTFFNTIETLANPANAAVHVASFYHLAFAKKLAETVDKSHTVCFDRLVAVQGLEGYDDLRPEHSTVVEWEDGVLHDRVIDSDAYGFELTEEVLEVGDVASDSARLTEDVVAGRGERHWNEAVALNAGLRLYAGRAVHEFEEGINRARDVIRRGDAADKLTELRSFSETQVPRTVEP